jgi:hypothetical protein
MASVDPSRASYPPKLPQALIESGGLSDAQLEVIVYADQAHSDVLPASGKIPERRRGFFDVMMQHQKRAAAAAARDVHLRTGYRDRRIRLGCARRPASPFERGAAERG